MKLRIERIRTDKSQAVTKRSGDVHLIEVDKPAAPERVRYCDLKEAPVVCCVITVGEIYAERQGLPRQRVGIR